MSVQYQYFIGIDVSKYSHNLAIVNQDNQVIKRNLVYDNTRPGMEKMMETLNQLGDSNTIAIGCEATGHYWLNLFHYLSKQDYHLCVFNPLQVASFKNYNLRGSKTDSDDSVLIAKVLKLGVAQSKKLPEEQRFELKELCRFRHNLKNQTVATKLRITTILDQIFPEFHTVFKDLSGKTAQAVLEDYPHPETLDNISVTDLTKYLKRASRSYFGKTTATTLKSQAKYTIGLKFGINCFTLQIKLLLQQLQSLEEQVKLLDNEIKRLVDAQQTHLTTIPGISHVIAGTILGETADFTSKGAKAFLAYCGLDPKRNDSGIKTGRSKMGKRGSRYLRQALWMAASSARMHSPTFKKVYDDQKDKGKHYMIAISHVAKKMAYVVDAVLRTDQPYKEMIKET
jgi:transposase